MISARSIHTVVLLACTMSAFGSPAWAQSNSKGPNSAVVVGTLTSVDSSGTKFNVLQSGEILRKLHVDPRSKVYFVGVPVKDDHKPKLGMGVKATCEKGGRVKTISFTPAIGQPEPFGEERLTMTESVLFKEADKDASDSISYIEFSKYIYHSTKHGPDAFRKADKNSDGVFDQAEFVVALSAVSWWKVSRKTPEEWFIQADVDKDGSLDIKEFHAICTSGNHIQNIFKRADRDQSSSLSQDETSDYIRSVTHGKQRKAKARQQD